MHFEVIRFIITNNAYVLFQVLSNFDIPDPCSLVELNIESFL